MTDETTRHPTVSSRIFCAREGECDCPPGFCGAAVASVITCGKCGAQGVAFICDTPVCPVNGGVYYAGETLLNYKQIDARDKIIAQAARDRALEDAAAECDRHAAFCKDEAHRGGDWKHFMARVEEAAYNAKRIRALKEQP